MDTHQPPARNLLLSELSCNDHEKLDHFAIRVHLDRNTVLAEAGDPINHVYFPHSGMISILILMKDGRTVETTTIGHSGAFGLLTGFGPRPSLGRAIVQLSGDMTEVSTTHWHQLVKESPPLQSLILRYNDVQTAQLQQAAACNLLHDLESRFSKWILQATDCIDGNILELTQEFIADTLGVKRTTVTILAQAMQAAGLIRYRRGRIVIINKSRLEQAACECYRTLRESDQLQIGSVSQSMHSAH